MLMTLFYFKSCDLYKKLSSVNETLSYINVSSFYTGFTNDKFLMEENMPDRMCVLVLR